MADLPPGVSFTDEEVPGLPKGVKFTGGPELRSSASPQGQLSKFLQTAPPPLNALGSIYEHFVPTISEGAEISIPDRAAVNLSVLDPLERAKAFRKLGYSDIDIDPKTKKATRKGVRIDQPPFTPSIAELGAEAIENVDAIPTAIVAALTRNPWATGATAGGVATLRDQLRKYLVPDAETDYTTIGLETGFAAAPVLKGPATGAATKIGETLSPVTKPIKENIVDPVARWVANKVSSSKPVRYVKGVAKNVSEAGKTLYDDYSSTAFEYLDETKKNIVRRFDDTFGITSDLRNLGVADDAFNAFNAVNIKDNFAKLIENNPEFKKIAYTGGTGVRGADAFDLFKNTGKRIKDYYKGSDVTVPLSAIADQPAFKEMMEGIYAAGKNNREEVAQLLGVKDDFLRRLWDITARRQLLNDPTTAQKAAQAGVGIEQYVFSKIQDVSEIAGDDLLEALSSQSVKLEDLWELRKVADAMAGWTATGRWFTENAGSNPKTTLVYQKFAGALRDTLGDYVDDPKIAKDIMDYSYMAPIVNAIVQKAAASTGKVFRPNDIYVSAIGGDLYRGLGYLSKFLRSPAAKGLGEGTIGKLTGGLKNMLSVDLASEAGEVATGPTAGQIGRQQMLYKGLADSISRNVSEDRNLALDAPPRSEAVDYILGLTQPNNLMSSQDQLLAAGGEQGGAGDIYQDPTSILQGIDRLQAPMPEPTPLPRAIDNIRATPEDMALIERAVSRNTYLLFQDAVNSDDPLKKRIATVEVMKEAPEIFEPGMYGIRSLIAEDDRFVIGDPAEAEMYRQTIKHLKGLGKVDEVFYTKQLSALNDPTDMTLYPRPDVTQRAPTPNPVEKASLLKQVATPAGSRRSYDY